MMKRSGAFAEGPREFRCLLPDGNVSPNTYAKQSMMVLQDCIVKTDSTQAKVIAKFV